MKFTKMHGLGNDFILVDSRHVELPNLPALARKLCRRRFGVGADQLLLLYSSNLADFRMRIFNADGSEVEMCGNGIRCVAKYIWDRKLSEKRVIEVETLAGIVRPEKAGGLVRVDMGEPIFDPEKIPVQIVQGSTFKVQSSGKGNAKGETKDVQAVIDYPLRIGDREFRMAFVSMGNPHAVIFVEGVEAFPVAEYGPAIENHPLFPKRTNVEFVEVLNTSEIRMRVWERGSGETMACGTGASASAVAAHLKGLTGTKTTVHLSGGDLSIEWAGDNHVYMTGPAVEVFDGETAL
ncbi:MAG: diaminopimelate epimerase [Nitrospirae bacterium]|nr:diaminopimelate epimerase [Nitrospirota bacterium]